MQTIQKVEKGKFPADYQKDSRKNFCLAILVFETLKSKKTIYCAQVMKKH